MRSSPLALTTLKSLNAEIKQLEAQKKLVEKRDGEVPKALAVLQRYSKVLTPAQRRQVAKIIGETVDAPFRRTATTPKVPLKGRKLGSVAPKYRLPTGETWTGRGQSPKVFTAWLKSAEGRAWVKANPGAKFPAAGGANEATKAGDKPSKTSRAKRVTNPPVKKEVKKATKRAGQVGETGKKATKKASKATRKRVAKRA
jgi:DNA-binding protein H-NS